MPTLLGLSNLNLPEDSRNTGTFETGPGNLSNHTYAAEH